MLVQEAGMTEHTLTKVDERRSFLARLLAGLGVAGAAVGGGAPVLQAQAPAGGRRFQATSHAQDDWLDQIRGGHRFVFDTTNAAGFGSALLYANNFFVASQNGYGLGDADAAVVIVARHTSTPYAYNDAVWAKYGTQLTALTGFNDPATKQPPRVNLYNTPVEALPSLGTTIDTLVKRGVRFAVCQMATQLFAQQLAQATGGTADAVNRELTSNLIGNARMVAAGILAVNRAQERGYTLATVA
jgi:intracellular sulfur oxidation DsrE/DsrF family protein